MTEFLLDPNLAYLVIVGGLLLTVLALLTPGTGVFELGALFALARAGWQLSNLPINLWALIVAFVGMASFALAIRPSGLRLVFLGVAVFGIVLGSAYLFRGEGFAPAVNPWLVITASLGSGGFLWIVGTKALAAHHAQPTHDLGRLMGATGVTRTEVHAEGTVFVNMEDWSAQSAAPIPAGERVRVIGREGLVLQVEAAEQG